MSGFISRSACRGRRPSAFASYRGRERSLLVTALLRSRDVARFIVAPDGYGKTSLAFEYADTVFAWRHVFWVNAKSPCFIRDIDDRCIAESCFAADSDAGLVVFDAIPVLDPERAQALSAEVDQLVAGGCEVVVTCTPMGDVFGRLQRDRVLVTPREMLLNDDEVDFARSADDIRRIPAEAVPASERGVGLQWSQEPGAGQRFAKSVLYDDMPADVLLLLGSSFVLQRGSLDDLLGVVRFGAQQAAELLADYPHVSVDGESARFEAPRIGMDELGAALHKRLPAMTAAAACGKPEDLVLAWAGKLFEAGDEARACELVSELYPRAKRGDWLVGNAFRLVGRACFLPVLHVAASYDASRGETRMRVCALQALSWRLLGDVPAALARSKQVAFAPATPDDARICCLLVLARHASGPLLQRALEGLGRMVDDAPESGDEAGGERMRSFWLVLADLCLASTHGPAELAERWRLHRDGGADEASLSIGASWLFNLLETDVDGSAAAASELAGPCERHVRAVMARDASAGPDFFTASAALSMEEAHGRGVVYAGGPLEAAVLVELRQVEMHMLVQRRTYEEEKLGANRRDNDWAETHPGMLLTRTPHVLSPKNRQHVPVLTLRLFGCFEVAIGDRRVDKKLFSRRNTRMLLVLLAVNQGREVPRETIIKSMWPTSPAEAARKSFYTVWSHLKKALSLPDGTCPYLVRQQYGCSLEARYVESDVSQLEDICRELLFGVPDMERWSQLYYRIDREFSSEFMPAEKDNPLIAQARTDYRNRLVDALVSATLAIAVTDTPQWGVWFGRTALRHDDTREDAYVALMRAQMASDQRTAAMMTYLQCRRVLSEKLGIDPSPETTSLYEDLLGGE